MHCHFFGGFVVPSNIVLNEYFSFFIHFISKFCESHKKSLRQFLVLLQKLEIVKSLKIILNNQQKYILFKYQ